MHPFANASNSFACDAKLQEQEQMASKLLASRPYFHPASLLALHDLAYH